MHSRSSTPDILGSIMTGEVKQENHKAIKPVILDEAKEKATFNLPVTLLTELEDTCHEIRKLCRSKQISKTLIVEEALKMAFADFKDKKQASLLFQILANHPNVR
ncbi:MAG: hypothetical protein JSS09_03470 [Verrucomicrobia bacterium]|nr:hypothetical protein [Verrucomicrobiota bacterium]